MNYKYKQDKDKPRLDLVPPGIIEAVGIIRTYGVQKYGENTNWKKVEIEKFISEGTLRKVEVGK